MWKETNKKIEKRVERKSNKNIKNKILKQLIYNYLKEWWECNYIYVIKKNYIISRYRLSLRGQR
jgi:hypothetical protein